METIQKYIERFVTDSFIDKSMQHYRRIVLITTRLPYRNKCFLNQIFTNIAVFNKTNSKSIKLGEILLEKLFKRQNFSGTKPYLFIFIQWHLPKDVLQNNAVIN